MAYQYTDQTWTTRYRLKNIKDYGTVKRSGTQIGQVSGYSTEALAIKNATQLAENKANSDISSVSSHDNIDSVFGLKNLSKGTISKDTATGSSNKDDGYRIGHTYTYNTSDKSLSTSCVPDGKTGNYSANATCNWSIYIGGGRNSYSQCYGFTLTSANFKEGQLKISWLNKGNFDYLCYVALSDTPSFLNDHTTKTYATFTLTKNTTNTTTTTIDLSSFKSAIISLKASTIYFIVGCPRINDGNQNVFVTNATLSFSYSYTQCAAPTTVDVKSSFVVPGGSIKVNWGDAVAGINMKISKYQVSYTIKDASGVAYGKEQSVESTSTSATITALGSDYRGYTYTFKVKAISSISSEWDSPVSTASATCRINRLPTLKITKNTSVVASAGGTPTATFTMTDSDGQNLTAYYKIGSGGIKTKIENSTSWTAPAKITEDTTYYFWAYDGFEPGAEISFTVKINEKPAFNTEKLTSTGRFKVNGTSYTSALKNEITTSYSYIPIITSINFAEIETKTATKRQYKLQYNQSLKTDGYDSALDTITDEKLNYFASGYNVAQEIGSTEEGRKWRLKYRYHDGTEYSDWIYSQGYSIAPWPQLTAIYNGHDGASFEGCDNEKYFYQRASVVYTEDTAFFGDSPASGSGWKISVDSGSFSRSQSEKINRCWNLIYTDPSQPKYGQVINFTLTTSWGDNSNISSQSLSRSPNLLENGQVSLSHNLLKPYSNTATFKATIPFAIGVQAENESTFSFREDLNLYKEDGVYTPLSAVVKIDGDDSVGLIYSNISNIGQADVTSVWDITNLQNFISNKKYSNATITFYCKTIFGEVFSTTAKLPLDYQEGVTISNLTAKILTNDTAEYVKLPFGSTLHEGEQLQFSFDYTGPNLQNLEIYLDRSKDGGNLWSYGLASTGGEIGTKNEPKTGILTLVVPSRSQDQEWKFRVRIIGSETKLTTTCLLGEEKDASFKMKRFTTANLGEFKVNYDDKSGFSIQTGFLDYGGSGETPFSEGLRNTEGKLILQYLKDGIYTEIGQVTKFPSDFAIINGTYAINASFPEGQTYVSARLAFIAYTPYTQIGSYQPINYSDKTAGIYKTTYSNAFMIYNIVPTVRYGENRVGINVLQFDDVKNLLELSANDVRDTVAAVGVSLNLDNFIISGGTWD